MTVFVTDALKSVTGESKAKVYCDQSGIIFKCKNVKLLKYLVVESFQVLCRFQFAFQHVL